MTDPAIERGDCSHPRLEALASWNRRARGGERGLRLQVFAAKSWRTVLTLGPEDEPAARLTITSSPSKAKPMKRLFQPWTALLAICLLSACASGLQPMPDAAALQPIQVRPQANLTQAPAQLPAPKSGSMRDLEANQRQVARQYHQLASQHCLLLAFLQAAPDGCAPWLAPDLD